MNVLSEQAQRIAEPVRMSLTRFILLATSIILLVGLGSMLAWLYTGRVECVQTFFAGPGALYLVFLAALGFALCRIVVSQFSAGEPLQPAWFLMLLSAGCQMVSSVCVHILSVPSALNPLAHGLVASETASDIHRFGLLVGGPLQILLMTGSLGLMLLMLRQRGLRPKLSLTNYIPLSLAGALTYFQVSDLVASGSRLTLYDLLSASTGPLLILLLVEASLVTQCMSAVEGGMIARCWNSFAAAILFTALGSIGLWLDSHGMLNAAPSVMSGFLGYLAATAYVLGPAWQIEAIQSACGEVGVPRFSPVASSLSALRLLNTGRAR